MGSGGNQVIPTSISWGFTPADIWSNTAALVSSVSGFILLALAVAFAPRIVSFLKGLFARGRKS
jgi:hypothetical protein